MNLSHAIKLAAERATANCEGEELLQGLQAIDAICDAIGELDEATRRLHEQARETSGAMLNSDEQQLRWVNLLTEGGKAE